MLGLNPFPSWPIPLWLVLAIPLALFLWFYLPEVRDRLRAVQGSSPSGVHLPDLPFVLGLVDGPSAGPPLLRVERHAGEVGRRHQREVPIQNRPSQPNEGERIHPPEL